MLEKYRVGYHPKWRRKYLLYVYTQQNSIQSEKKDWRKTPERYIETKGPIKGIENFKTTNEEAH